MRRRGRKLNFKRIFIVLIIVVLLIFSIYTLFTFDIRNIYVSNNNYLDDQKIIDIANLSDYPNFFITTKGSIKRKTMVSPYIKSVDVSKKWLGKIYIDIEEEKFLFYKSKGIIVLGNGEEITEDSLIVNVPILSNYIEEKYYSRLIDEMNKLDQCVISKISQIEFKPNDIDPERFLLYMNDGNYVYLTLLTFDTINNYNEIVLQLEGENGIMYLDSGNYFEIID